MERGIGSAAAAVTAGEVVIVDPATGTPLGTATNPVVTTSAGTVDQDVNLVGINGVAPSVGSGASGTGVQRVILATNDPAVTALTAVNASLDDIEAALEAPGVTYTSNSITSATGASQTLAALSASRKALVIINPLSNTTDWTVDPLGGTAVADTPPGFRLRPGDSWSPYPVPVNAITGIGTSTSKLIVLVG